MYRISAGSEPPRPAGLAKPGESRPPQLPAFPVIEGRADYGRISLRCGPAASFPSNLIFGNLSKNPVNLSIFIEFFRNSFFSERSDRLRHHIGIPLARASRKCGQLRADALHPASPSRLVRLRLREQMRGNSWSNPGDGGLLKKPVSAPGGMGIHAAWARWFCRDNPPWLSFVRTGTEACPYGEQSEYGIPSFLEALSTTPMKKGCRPA